MADSIYMVPEEHFLYNCEETLQWIPNPLYCQPWCDQVFIEAEACILSLANKFEVKLANAIGSFDHFGGNGVITNGKSLLTWRYYFENFPTTAMYAQIA